MNAFYERLTHFAQMVNDASKDEKYSYAQYFQVQHPSYPVVSRTRSLMPKLVFEDDCPTALRRKVRLLLKKSFNRIKNKI